MAMISKLLVALASASAVAVTTTTTMMMFAKPLPCLSFPVSHYSRKRWRQQQHTTATLRRKRRQCTTTTRPTTITTTAAAAAATATAMHTVAIHAAAPAAADDEIEAAGPTRKRWRRRRRRKVDDSVAVVGSSNNNNEDNRVTTTTDENNNEQPSSSKKYCPILYSMKFPRYRISLTTNDDDDTSSPKRQRLESEKRRTRRRARGFITKLSDASSSNYNIIAGDGNHRHRKTVVTNPAIRNGGDNGNNTIHPLLKSLLNRIVFREWNNPSNEVVSSKIIDWRDRQAVESFYREETMRGRFRWITSYYPSSSSSSSSSSAPSSSSSNSTTTTTTGSTRNNAPDEDFHAAASFWRMASDIILTARGLASSSQKEDDDDDMDRRRPTMTWYLALPETTSTVARHLCDTLNWYADYTMEQYKKKIDDDAAGETPSLPLLRLPPLLLRADVDTRANNGKIPIVRFTLLLLCQEVPWQQGQEQEEQMMASLQQQQQQQQQQQRRQRQSLLPTPEDTERRTKAWVRRVLVQLGICPFTKSDIKSGQGLRDFGVPVANIMYRHSSAVGSLERGTSEDVYLLMADTWEAISDMVAAGPTGVSSILLSAPGFDDDFQLWAGPIFAMLETCVGAIQAEEMIGIVCFHPKYVTPDGTSWPGFGHMHSVPRLKEWYNRYTTSLPSSSLSGNETPSVSQSLSDNEIAAGGAWQRRTPHSVINVLRAEQLEAAEGRRRTGELYGRNIKVLVGSEGGVGLEKLSEDLRREQCM